MSLSLFVSDFFGVVSGVELETGVDCKPKISSFEVGVVVGVVVGVETGID